MKDSILASKQNRSADPFMVDHMLCNSGLGSESAAADFVNKYNAQVFYDADLVLQNHAEKRQVLHLI